MGFWVNALCTESVAGCLCELEEFFDALDFAELETQAGGIEGFDPPRLRESLAIDKEALPPPFDTVWFSVSYDHGGENEGISWDRYTAADLVRRSVSEFREGIADNVSPTSAEQITSVLSAVREVVSARLPTSSVDRFEWPLAQEMGFWFAQRGAGLLIVEGEWFDPNTRAQL